MKAARKVTRFPSMTLGELEECGVVSLGRGKVISKRDLAATPGTYPVYSSAKENDGKFGEYGEFMFDEELITWSVDGGGRFFHRTKHRFSVTNVGGTLRVNDTARLHCRFLYFMLSYLHSIVTFDWVQKAHPSVIRKVYDTIPLPPLEEQRQIVAVLDKALTDIATATANAEKNRANARELQLSYLSSQLSDSQSEPWKQVPLGDVCEVLDRLRKPVTKSDRRAGEYPYYGASGIVDWIDDYIFNEPLVLLGEDGAKWGAGERSSFSASGKYWVNNHSHIIRPDRKILRDAWLVYFLNMADLMPYITGITVPKLNQERMRSIPISLPPLMIQDELVARMDVLSEQAAELIELNTRKLACLAAFKQSLLHRAFTGELNAGLPETIAA